MKTYCFRWWSALSVFLLPAFLLAAEPAAPAPAAAERDKAQKLFRDGNFKDACDILQKLVLDPKAEPLKIGADLDMALDALMRLNRANELDGLLEKAVAVHPNTWRLLYAAATSYAEKLPHWGYLIAGEFTRGAHRGGGRYVNSSEHDRVRGLQLMTRALERTKGETDAAALAEFHLRFADMLLGGRGWSEAWRLQYLTDLGELPDYEEGYRYYRSSTVGAPVNPDNTPVFHSIPKTYADARTDGERWRWMLLQAMELAPSRVNEVQSRFADFLRGQFGVQTMADFGRYFSRVYSEEDRDKGPRTYDLHTLDETETIARLATGIQRFKLPDEFNYIRLYQKIADSGKSSYGESALDTLAGVFENRRQYDRAAEFWKRGIKEYGPGHDNYKEKRLDQILGNWGQFEPIMTQPAGKGATVEFRFRNGTRVHFEAQAIDVRKLLADVKDYIKSAPAQLDWERMNIGDIGYRIVQKNDKKYVTGKVAEWDLDLKPRPMHFDTRITVATPLQKAGAYLLSATMADGNTCRIIIWIDDTVIVKKLLDNGSYLFVADAATGAPIPKANIEFFGYRQEWVQGTKRYNITVTDYAEMADEKGQVIASEKAFSQNYQWLLIATTRDGRFAHLGFTRVWYGRAYDQEYNQTKVYLITDRPVYRPAQPVRFKFWVRQAKYDDAGEAFAGQSFPVEIRNPRGDKVFEKTFTADDYGGFDGEFTLPKDAMLGQYSVQLPRRGGGFFRVEEYKKPEFEVKVDAPAEPVMLGEKIAATVTAKYYFGAPVTTAKVKYKVLRTDHSATWYPIDPWDWLYGRGYWWFGYDYLWYPGWKEWGCERPRCWWWPASYSPPEVVAENEVPIGPDGMVKIRIDTAPAKEIHGDSDHKYDVTVEVTDESRRTITGSGSVLVARKPFRVYTWVDRGHYRVGDTIRTECLAQTLDSKPVPGKGQLTLFRVSYDKNNQPVEAAVQKWALDADEFGKARLQIKASQAGQYRLSYKVTSAKDQTLEGACLFCVMGAGFDGAQYRFNNVELVADKREYAPGDKVKLMINTDRPGGTVVLFLRPANGIYRPPEVIPLSGKSTVREVEVTKRDMPNFFIEAFTICDGKLHSEAKEIAVPPEKRVLNVEVLPSADSYKPGARATVKVRLTDFFGKPFMGSAVMAVYDKAVEYISGGSNVSDIKAFFWKWRRSHHPQSECSLDRAFGNLTDPARIAMQSLGVFGYLVADEQAKDEGSLAHRMVEDRGSAAFKTGAGLAMPRRELAMADAAPATAMRAAGMAVEGEDKMANAMMASAPGTAAPEEAVVQPVVRTQFADTAFWAAALATDSNGVAEVSFAMPENLTGWKIRTWAMGHNTDTGEGEAAVVTTKNLLLRLQAPRFFVEKDEVVLSANIHNYLKTRKTVTAVLELGSGCLSPIGKATQTLIVEPNGEKRADWRVKVLKEGEAVVRMKALTDEESDAMEMKFPVYVHGMLKTDSFSGFIRRDQEKASLTVTVPAERRIDESRLEVRYSPTLAGAMVDALPYLADYPYGCTEQVLNRFLPAVITQKILMDMGLNLKAIREKRTNLNAQEIGDDRERAKQWKRFERNPVFEEETLRDMVKEGVKQLTAMQCDDGGWGWFSGWGERSYPHTTAYIVHGLQIARDNDVALVPGVLERGVEWLTRYQAEQVRMLRNPEKKVRPSKSHADNLDAFVYMILTDAGVKSDEMLEFLYRDRNELSCYGKAMYGMALYKLGQKDKLTMILQNIEQFLVRDDENQTAYLNLQNGGFWWYWYGSEYESLAYYLKLLAKTDPKGETASRLVKHLLNNRKHATYWNSTRDTAICVEAMADFLRASGEDRPDMTVEIYVDGKKHKEVKINADNLFTFDNKFVLFGDAVESGKHVIEFRKKGTGPLYFNAYLTNFTLEDFIRKAGLEIKVDRAFYKLTPLDKTIKVAGSRGQAVDQKVEKYKRTAVENLATLKSGDLVEIELTIESKNDYEYLIFEDMKAAGCEPVEVRSGYGGNDLGAYMELRDERVCFFVRALARGRHSVAYRMRAEIPGRFSALPTRASAMYAPELRANSDEIKLIIED